ncbi:MAG: DUF4268 domain-containing protein [Solirubrobacterales bacterium]|nr:DUF4268 domain-containing protein [Solirubrobacterales bacterium]
MKADVKTLSNLALGDIRYLIPRYQRPYVWNEDDHWEPLWDDIEASVERLGADEPADHFLGAIVLQYETTPPGEPSRFQVIDGQQRLTTIQILLAAATNTAAESGVDRTARLLRKMVLNDPDIAEGDLQFKVWPTESDRHAFRLIASLGGPPIDAPNDPNNTIQEAYSYFQRRIADFVLGDGSDPEGIENRMESFRVAISDLFKIVAITLEGNDEAQVIFETLNARGTPLLAMDLVKNATFHAAEQQGAPIAELHDEVWEPEFGRPYWREEIRQGRLTKPRAELFLMHWMTMKLASSERISRPIRSDLVFKTFRSEFLTRGPTPEELIRELTNDAAVLRSFDDFAPSTPEGRYFRTIDYMETGTFIPVALWLFTNQQIEITDRQESLRLIESFLIRRALMGWTSKAYNKIALDLLGKVGSLENNVSFGIGSTLARSTDGSSTWPADDDLRKRLAERPLYGWVSRKRVAGMLSEVELLYRASALTEDVSLLDQSLSIEHVLPQTWEDTWPLEQASPSKVEARNELVNVLGNLTLVTGSLNSALSNQAWPDKRERYREHSLLMLNNRLAKADDWDESSIRKRGSELTDRIIEIWPGPSAFAENDTPTEKIDVPKEMEPERAEMSEPDLLAAFDEGSDLFKTLLIDLAKHPESRRALSEIEAGIGWPNGKLASVLGSYVMKSAEFSGKRPYRTYEDGGGTLWLWIDAIRASILLEHVESNDEGGGHQGESSNPETPVPAAPSEANLLKQQFWTALKSHGEQSDSILSFRSPRPVGDYSFTISKSEFYIALCISSTKKKEISCELYLPGRFGAKRAFAQLESRKESIESLLGPLEWMSLPERKACRIVDRTQGDIDDPAAWPELLDWCLDRATAFHAVFSRLIDSLDLRYGRTD